MKHFKVTQTGNKINTEVGYVDKTQHTVILSFK